MPKVLDEKLLGRIAHKIGKSRKYTREQISKQASRQGISSEARQILWAKELGIGAARFQRSLPPHIQQEVREHLPVVFASQSRFQHKNRVEKSRKRTQKAALTAAIEYLLKDDELRNRCSDLLRARGNFDRAFREATTILDYRLKKLAGLTNVKIDPGDLVAKVLYPNNRIFELSADTGEQEGFFFICKGLFQAFRNPTHHQLSDKFSREDALRFCGFVDVLLTVLQRAHKVR
jgi:hypothetical protein